MSAPVIEASGTRSPLAPIDPNSRTCGVTSALRKTSSRRTSSRPIPDAPRRCELARMSMAARTSSRGQSTTRTGLEVPDEVELQLLGVLGRDLDVGHRPVGRSSRRRCAPRQSTASRMHAHDRLERGDDRRVVAELHRRESRRATRATSAIGQVVPVDDERARRSSDVDRAVVEALDDGNERQAVGVAVRAADGLVAEPAEQALDRRVDGADDDRGGPLGGARLAAADQLGRDAVACRRRRATNIMPPHTSRSSGRT